MGSLKDKSIMVEKLGVMEKPFLACKSDHVKKAVKDFAYLSDFLEGKIIFPTLQKDCEIYFFKNYNIDIWKINISEAIKIIFGEYEK